MGSLTGFTVATFGPSHKNATAHALASSLSGVKASQIAITVSAGRRRLRSSAWGQAIAAWNGRRLSSSIQIDYTVSGLNAAEAASVINSVGAGLNAEQQAEFAETLDSQFELASISWEGAVSGFTAAVTTEAPTTAPTAATTTPLVSGASAVSMNFMVAFAATCVAM